MPKDTVGFEHYIPETEDAPVTVLAISVAYVGVLLGFVLILLTRERKPNGPQDEDKSPNEDDDNDGDSVLDDAEVQAENNAGNGDDRRKWPQNDVMSQDIPTSVEQPQRHASSSSKLENSDNKISDITKSSNTRGSTAFSVASSTRRRGPSGGPLPTSASIESSAPVEHNEDESIPRPLRSWDLMSSSAMRFRHGHFSGRSVQRLVQQERHAQEGMINGEGSSYGSQSRGSSWNSRRTGISRGGGAGPAVMSDLATQVLESQTVEGEADFYRQRYIQKSALQRHHQQQMLIQQQQQNPGGSRHSLSSSRRLPFLSRRTSGSPSVISRTSSGRSRMPRLSSDILSPEDAADAFDQGVSVSSESFPQDERDAEPVASGCCGNLLDLAEPDMETRRILFLAAPSTLGAIAEPCFRLGMVAIISHFLDIDSMIAFVLVILFVRITTEELSGAITDAESSMLHQALSMGGEGGFTLAGRQIQLAVLMQFVFAIPVLIAWALAMDPVVSWLIPENERVGELAAEYTRIIVIDYGLQAASRTFLLVFHLTGQAQFELYVDLCATAVTIVAIALTASLAAEPTLSWIGWIQVVIGLIKIGIKIGFVVFKGLLEPYRKGLFGSLSILDRQAAWAFVGTTLPLLMGSLIELREWEILILFVRHLGGAEVATWALMGIIWEIFEASTEGLGEAAAVRVSLILSENLPDVARVLAHKSVLMGMVESMIVTGVFLMIGRNLSVALTQDAMIQHLFNDLVGTTGLANIAMSLSQIYWSLLGAQGRFGAASSAILLCRWLMTMPLAALYIFGTTYELPAVGAALSVGYMTSSAILAWRLYRSDWSLYARLARDEVMPGEDFEDLGLLEGDEEEDEDDIDFDDDSSDSTGFG